MSLTRNAWALAITFLSGALSADAADRERYFPAETEAIVTVNVRQILASKLLQPELERIRRELDRNAQVRETLQSLGFDPLKDLDSVVLAGASFTDSQRVLVLLTGRFDVARFQRKAQEIAQAQGALLKIHREHGQTIYETNLAGQSKALFVAVLDASTIVASFNKGYVGDSLEIRSGAKRPGLREEMRQMLARLTPGLSVAVAGTGAAVMKGVADPERIRDVTGGITIGDDIRTDFTIRAKDAAAAAELARFLREGLDQGKNFLTLIAMNQVELAPLVALIDTLTVTEQGSDIILHGVVTAKQLSELKTKR
jgi:hypothetical protein